MVGMRRREFAGPRRRSTGVIVPPLNNFAQLGRNPPGGFTTVDRGGFQP
jgi:hypothetical protein